MKFTRALRVCHFFQMSGWGCFGRMAA